MVLDKNVLQVEVGEGGPSSLTIGMYSGRGEIVEG